jgi:hypothetical protein
MTTVANIIDAVEARVGNAITTTTDFTKDQCYLWIDDACEDIQKLLIEYDSELGRTLGSITTVADTSYYTDLTLLVATAQYGWILKTNERVELELTTEKKSIEFDPSNTDEPTHFYLDGSNRVNFLPVPDDAYTIKIPYWKQHTIITSDDDTIPYHGVFDRVIIETVVVRYQNREEYEPGYEVKWLSYLRDQAKKIIMLRKGHRVSVG